MPVPTDITTLSTTASSNSPPGAEAAFPNLDNYLRQIFAFVAELRDDVAAIVSGNGYAELAGSEFTGPVSVAFVGLTDAATIATNALLGNNFRVTLGANRVLGNPTGLRDGGVYEWHISQDGAGGRTLSFGSFFKFASGTAPTITATANALTVIRGTYNGTLGILACTAILDVR